MVVVHIIIDHTPRDVRVFYKQARSLALAGHEVHLIVAGLCEDVVDGVRFHSSGPRIVPPRWPALFRRFGILAQYAKRLWGSYRVARALRADVYQVHEPMLILVGTALGRSGARVVYDAHEEYRQVALRVQGRRPVAGRVLFAWYTILEGMARRRFDMIIAATPTIAGQFPRAEVVRNYPIRSEFAANADTPYRDRGPRVVYAGGISDYRGVNEMVQAMGLVPEHLAAKLDLVGRFPSPALEAAVRALRGWDAVDFHGWSSREEVNRVLGTARAGLVVLRPAPNHTESLPNKMFEYMASGIPVIASDFPLWRTIVSDAGCGLLVDPLDPAAIAAAITWVLEHPSEAEEMGRRGAEAVRERYNWEQEAGRLVALYQERLGRPGVVRRADVGGIAPSSASPTGSDA